MSNIKYQKSQAEDFVRSDLAHNIYDGEQSVQRLSKGLDEEKVREISRLKGEPEWMLERRLQGYKIFREMDLPSFGPDISNLDLDSMTYYNRATNKAESLGMQYPKQLPIHLQ